MPIRGNLTADWTMQDNVRPHLRIPEQPVLRKHYYRSHKSKRETCTALEQAEV